MAPSNPISDPEEIKSLALRLKELYEESMLRDPSLNADLMSEIKEVTGELIDTGLWVVIETKLVINPDDPSHPSYTAHVTLGSPKISVVN